MTFDDIADQLVAALLAEVPEYPAITDMHGGPPYRVCTHSRRYVLPGVVADQPVAGESESQSRDRAATEGR